MQVDTEVHKVFRYFDKLCFVSAMGTLRAGGRGGRAGAGGRRRRGRRGRRARGAGRPGPARRRRHHPSQARLALTNRRSLEKETGLERGLETNLENRKEIDLEN